MAKLPTSHAQFCNMLHACIDLSDYPVGSTLKGIIEGEKQKPLTLAVVEDWLRGMPSACSIPCYRDEVEAILKSSGNGHWSDDDYWRFAASRILDFALNPSAYADVPKVEPIEFTRVKNDVNGNGRVVCHFLNLNTRAELDASGEDWIPVSQKYVLALARSRKLGGKKFHNKQYGGGIVFQETDTRYLEKAIRELVQADS